MDDGLTPWQPLLTASFFETLTRRVKDGGGGTCVSGLTEGARALIVTLLARETKRKLLVVVPDDAALDHWRRDLAAAAALTGGDPGRTAILPALDADPYGGLAPHPEVVRDRVQVLQKLAHDEVDLLVTPARGLLNPLRTRCGPEGVVHAAVQSLPFNPLKVARTSARWSLPTSRP